MKDSSLWVRQRERKALLQQTFDTVDKISRDVLRFWRSVAWEKESSLEPPEINWSKFRMSVALCVPDLFPLTESFVAVGERIVNGGAVTRLLTAIFESGQPSEDWSELSREFKKARDDLVEALIQEGLKVDQTIK